MGKYYIGLDTSTSSTGFAIIDSNDKIICSECIRTKEDWKKNECMGNGYKMISNTYKDRFYKAAQEIYKVDSQAHFTAAIECNTVMNGFGKGLDTTMKLGVTVGLAISNLLKNFCIDDIKLSAVGNWRNNLIENPAGKTRDELKLEICNWVENHYGIHLPLFPVESEGIKTTAGYRDCRNNDIADAVGLAYTCRMNLLEDRKQLKIINKRQDKVVRALKAEFDKKKKKIESAIKEKDEKLLNILVKDIKKHYNLCIENKADLKRYKTFIEKVNKYDIN